MLYFVFVLSLLAPMFIPNTSYTGMPMPFPNQAQMSPDELEKMNAEIAKFTQELEKIDEFVATMSPEDQAEFFKQVEEVQKALNAMTPEEMNQLMEEMASMAPELFGDIPPEMLYQPIEQPTALETALPEEITSTKRLVLSEESETLLESIEDLIAQLNSFLAQMNTSQELPFIIDRWIGQGKISSILSTDITWLTIYKNIELLVVRLSLLQEQSPINKNYIHLQAASENATIVSAIQELNKLMHQHLPHIETNSFGIKKISKKSKDAIKFILEVLSPALMNEIFTKAIDGILKEYEPTAQKLKDAQKIAQDYVKQLSRAVSPQQAIVAGKNIESDYQGNDYASSFGSGSGSFGSSYYGQNFGSTIPYGQGFSSDSGLNWDSLTPLSESNQDKNNLPSDKKTETEKKEKPVAILSADKEQNQNSVIDKQITEIEEKLNAIYESLQENAVLKNISAHLINAKEPLDWIAASYTINNLENKITILERNIQIVENKIVNLSNEAKKAEYINQMYEIYNKKAKKTIEDFIAQISEIQDNWSTFESKISPEKKFAYFKIDLPEKKSTEKESEQKQELPPQSTKTLFELMNACKKLHRTFTQFGKIK